MTLDRPSRARIAESAPGRSTADEAALPAAGATRSRLLVLVPALVLIFGGGLLAWSIQTAGGRIQVRDIRFATSDDRQMSALLYVPPGASPEHPAPGVLAVHGYINSRETQDGFAIELARRGYVVLALDQTGHGYSDPPAFEHGFGGPDGLQYLRSLEFVDPANIGLEGHSMGGWAVLAAAAAHPSEYRSVVLVGSSSGNFGTPPGTASFPRNLGLVFSVWDEFSELMWSAPIAQDIARSKKLQTQFGTRDPVQIGKLYGSLADGSARQLYMPRTIHAQDHASTEAIGNAIEWLQRTLQGGQPLPPQNQIWYWKELGTLLVFAGLIAALFPLGDWLLDRRFFAELREPAQPARGMTGTSWRLSAALSAAIPVLSYFPFQNLGTLALAPSALFPQRVTTGIMCWACGNALISFVLFARWHRATNRERGATRASYGLSWSGAPFWRRAGKSLLLALALIALMHGLLGATVQVFGVDARFWVLALKPLDALHLRIVLGYLLPFAIFFVMLGIVLHGQLRRDGASLGREMVLNAALLTSGFIALLAVQYVPLLSGSALPLGEPLLTIVAFQFLPLLAIAALLSTYFFRKTGHVYVGAFINALFITGTVVAGQATHFAM